MTLLDTHRYQPRARCRIDELAAWRARRRREKRRAERLLRAMVAASFLLGAAGFYLVSQPLGLPW